MSCLNSTFGEIPEYITPYSVYAQGTREGASADEIFGARAPSSPDEALTSSSTEYFWIPADGTLHAGWPESSGKSPAH